MHGYKQIAKDLLKQVQNDSKAMVNLDAGAKYHVTVINPKKNQAIKITYSQSDDKTITYEFTKESF